MKLFAAALALTVATASAEILEIKIEGEFMPRENAQFFSTTWPVNYQFMLRFDTSAPDLSPEPSFGLYQSPDQPFSLVLSTGQSYEGLGTEVHVVAGWNGEWGFSFGPAFWLFGSDGLQVAPYESYFSALSPFPISQRQTPTDEVSWLSLGEHESPSSYLKWMGDTPGFDSVKARVQDNLQESFFVTVPQVPEGNASALLSFGILLMLLPRFR